MIILHVLESGLPGERERERERERGPGTWGKVYSDIDHIQFPAPHFGPVALSG